MKLKFCLAIILIFFITFSFPVSAQYLESVFVTDIGGFGDNYYNDQLQESLEKTAENLNIDLEFKESDLMVNYIDNLNFYAKKKFNPIWTVGFTMEQAVKESAQMYPESNFIIFDAVVEEENVMSLTFKKEEEAFLAGIIAALATDNNAVAFVGGRENNEIQKYQSGFNKAVQNLDSEIKVLNKYIGSYDDFSQAVEITKSLAAEKIDVIFYTAGSASQGIIETALVENINLISLNPADKFKAPNNIITIIKKNTDSIVQKTFSSFYNDNYVNEVKKFGLKDNAFIIDKKQAKDMMSSENLKKIEEYKQQFISGEINNDNNLQKND